VRKNYVPEIVIEPPQVGTQKTIFVVIAPNILIGSGGKIKKKLTAG